MFAFGGDGRNLVEPIKEEENDEATQEEEGQGKDPNVVNAVREILLCSRKSDKDVEVHWVGASDDCDASAGDCNPDEQAPVDINATDKDLSAHGTALAQNTSNSEGTATEQLAMMQMSGDEESTTSLEQPLTLVRSASLPTRERSASLPEVATAQDNSDNGTGYLYLNASGNSSRPRANSASESMESTSSAPAAPSLESHKIPIQCAICLDDYERGDIVVTSCSECPHAFHQQCIVEWLVKMQDGTPCPCCRRTFVDLDVTIPRNNSNGGGNSVSPANNNNNANDSNQDPEEAERRQERRRRIEQGIQRGRAFNVSVISIR